MVGVDARLSLALRQTRRFRRRHGKRSVARGFLDRLKDIVGGVVEGFDDELVAGRFERSSAVDGEADHAVMPLEGTDDFVRRRRQECNGDGSIHRSPRQMQNESPCHGGPTGSIPSNHHAN
jgi:hypothetical protein